MLEKHGEITATKRMRPKNSHANHSPTAMHTLLGLPAAVSHEEFVASVASGVQRALAPQHEATMRLEMDAQKHEAVSMGGGDLPATARTWRGWGRCRLWLGLPRTLMESVGDDGWVRGGGGALGVLGDDGGV